MTPPSILRKSETAAEKLMPDHLKWTLVYKQGGIRILMT